MNINRVRKVALGLGLIGALSSLASAQCMWQWDNNGLGSNGSQYGSIFGTHRHNTGSTSELYAFGRGMYLDGAYSPYFLYKHTSAGWIAMGDATNLELPESGFDGNQTRAAATWDPDGAGPLRPLLAFGGQYQNGLTSVLSWDGEQFGVLAYDLGGSWSVESLAVFQGELYACGNIGNPSTNMRGVVRWLVNATDPSPLDEILVISGEPRTLVVHNDGSGDALYIAGFEMSVLGVPNSSGIVRWTGTQWQSVGGGLPSANVMKLLSFDPDGAGALPSQLVAIMHGEMAVWDGAVWTRTTTSTLSSVHGVEFGIGGVSGAATVVSSGSGNVMLIGGDYPDTTSGVLRYDGSSFAIVPGLVAHSIAGYSYLGVEDLGFGPQVLGACIDDGAAGSTAVVANGPARGFFAQGSDGKWTTAGSPPTQNVQRAPNGQVFVHDLDGAGPNPPALMFGGTVTNVHAGTSLEYRRGTELSRWNGTSWEWYPTSGIAKPYLLSKFTARTPTSPLYAVAINEGEGSNDAHVVRLDGNVWTRLGNDANFTDRYGLSLVTAMIGGQERLYAYGKFTQIGESSISNIAEWNGSAWVRLGTGLGTPTPIDIFRSATAFNDGTGESLYVSGEYYTGTPPVLYNIYNFKWNGSTWTSAGNGLPADRTVSFAVASGHLHALYGSGSMYRLNNGVWTDQGSFLAGDAKLLGAANDGSRDKIYVSSRDSSSGRYSRGYSYDEESGWTEVPGMSFMLSGTDFQLEILGPVRFDMNNQASLWFSGDFCGVGVYESSPVNEQPYVDFRSPLSTHTPAAGLARYFCSAPACPADFNTSGSVTVQDIFDFLAAWFAGTPSADFNTSGSVTVQDIFDFLAAWFAGC